MSWDSDAGIIPASRIIGQDFTVATLPAAADYKRMYAWASDLFGGPGDYVISDGVNWKPVRPLALFSGAAADMTITALLSAPTQIMTGAIATATAKALTLSTSYVYPGAKFRIVRKATGLGGLLVNGLGLSLNGWADMEWSAGDNAWVQTASGGLL